MKLSAIILTFSIFIFTVQAAAVSFDVTVVSASKGGSGFDQSLGPYKKQLAEMGYRSARVISRPGFSVNLNQKRSFTVKGNVTAEIVPTSVSNGFINFDFKMIKGNKIIVRLSYRIPNGKHTIIVGPSERKRKYILIIRASD